MPTARVKRPRYHCDNGCHPIHEQVYLSVVVNPGRHDVKRRTIQLCSDSCAAEFFAGRSAEKTLFGGPICRGCNGIGYLLVDYEVPEYYKMPRGYADNARRCGGCDGTGHVV